MQKILISACLVGDLVKYNGGNNQIVDPLLVKWQKEGRLVTICPEVSGGLPVPRNPVEIQNGEGKDVLSGGAKAVDASGNDVSTPFIQGANAALKLAQQHGITIAILKERSPSCGSQFIYNGNFDGTLIKGKGITTTLLNQHGIKVFNESQLKEVDALL